MGARHLHRIVEHLGGVLLRQNAAGADAVLLERFLAHRDGTAFEVLVRRHGPMVMGVCRRILHNSHDAEDAFQATFLVLVRKASTIRPPSMVGNWLYGVAYRTAQEARKTVAKRRLKEANAIPRTEAVKSDWDDLYHVLDQELARLPEKYRAVIVHCDLEGKTRKQVAEQLGWPEGTVASRLSTARTLLAKRLTRQGFGTSAAIVAAIVGPNATACVSPSVVSSSVRAGMLFAAGSTSAGAVSASVIALTQGVLQSMLLSKLKLAAAVVLVLGLLVVTGGVLAQRSDDKTDQLKPQTKAGQEPRNEKPANEKKAESAKAIKKLKEERLALLEKIHEAALKQLQSGAATEEHVHKAMVDVLAARLDLAEKAEDRIQVLKEAVVQAEAWEKTIARAYQAGQVPQSSYLRAQAYTLETRIDLEKAKAGHE
jgi:RNA polymerase sigma factor (sigma-70 family)